MTFKKHIYTTDAFSFDIIIPPGTVISSTAVPNPPPSLALDSASNDSSKSPVSILSDPFPKDDSLIFAPSIEDGLDVIETFLPTDDSKSSTPCP